MNNVELPDWTYRVDHLKRSIRYSGDVDILVEWANEAFSDLDAVISIQIMLQSRDVAYEQLDIRN